jgi:dienelactone hydrolase
VTSPAGVVWQATDEPAGPPVAGVTVWLRGTWPDNYTTIAAVFAPPGDGPFPAVVYLHEAAGLTEAQLDVARRISLGGFIVVAGCEHDFARVPCKRRVSLFETKDAFVDLAKRLPRARPEAAALVGASANATGALYTASTRRDISAVVADSGVGLQYPDAPVLLLASRADTVIGGVVEQAQEFETTLRARGTIVESHYYDVGGHIVLVNSQTTDDAVRRVIDFLSRYAKR